MLKVSLVLLLLAFVNNSNAFSPGAFWHSSTYTTNKNKINKIVRQPTKLLEASFHSPFAHSSGTTSISFNTNGLSRFHHSILSRKADRQRFVTGKYPLTVTIVENPTRKWLGRKATSQQQFTDATTEILVNNTAPLRSLASLDRFHWLDEDERRDLLKSHAMISLEFIAEIHIDRPGYLRILPSDGPGSTMTESKQQHQQQHMRYSWNQWKPPVGNNGITSLAFDNILNQINNDGIQSLDEPSDRLWVTGFSLTKRQGIVKSVDSNGEMNSVNERTSKVVLWPNEVATVPSSLITNRVSSSSDTSTSASSSQDALLIADGFLVPGKDRGGIYIVKNPGDPNSEWTVSLTDSKEGSDRWFYHRSVWLDLTGDGRQSILTCRCQVTPNIVQTNEGVTSGISKRGQLVWLECPRPYTFDPETGTPLERDGTTFDPFNACHLPWKTHVLAEGPDVMMSVADMDPNDGTIEVISSQFFHKKVSLHSIKVGTQPKVVLERIIDDCCGSAFGCILANLDCLESSTDNRHVVDAGSTVPELKRFDPFSHVLVTSHENSLLDKDKSPKNDKNGHHQQINNEGGSLYAYRVPDGKDAWKTKPWLRTTISTGFKVDGQLSNMINPGAPGFVYTFHAKKKYDKSKRPMIVVAGDCAESAYLFRPFEGEDNSISDPSACYKLMVEFRCGATVGSIGIGYDDFTDAIQEPGYAKLYIPCYEKDKVLVFALGSGEDEVDTW